MKTTLSVFTFIIIALSSLPCFGDFSYIIKNPGDADAEKYVISKSNISLRTEGPNTYLCPSVGAETKTATSPGVIIYHFPLSKPITEVTLFTRTTAFHWSYSQGHTYIYVSTDGDNWIKAAEATTPEYGGYKAGNISGPLPSSFTGEKNIYVKVELYSYGESAAKGGSRTNTAQHLRYDSSSDNVTLQLEVTDSSKSSVYTTGSASFDSATGLLHIPCVGVGSDYFWADFNVTNWSPLTFGLLAAGPAQGDEASCARMNIDNLSIDVPRLFIGQNSYQLRLNFQPPSSFTLSDFQDDGAFGEGDNCYAGCDQPNDTYENIRCAVSCDSLFGGNHALITGGYPHIYLGPTSWGQCSQFMIDMNQPGW